MGMFWVRVELHKGAIAVPSSEYTELHDAMAKIGFCRAIRFGANAYSLPPGEYFANTGTLALNVAATKAKMAATSVLKTGQTCSLLIGELNGLDEYNLPERPPAR